MKWLEAMRQADERQSVGECEDEDRQGNFHAGGPEDRMNSHSHRKRAGESFTLGLAMKSSADTTNTPFTRAHDITSYGHLEVLYAD